MPVRSLHELQLEIMAVKGIEVAEALSISPSSVSRIVETCGNVLDNRKEVAVMMADMEI